jgi:hypothetical protein
MHVAAKSAARLGPRNINGASAPSMRNRRIFYACPFNGGLCEAPSRVAGTVAGRSNLVTVRHHHLGPFDAGGLQTFNGDCYV